MRQQLRILRNQITKHDRLVYGNSVLQNLLKTNILKTNNIAVYFSVDNEVPTQQIINFLVKHHKNIYLPIVNNNKLIFARLGKKFRINNFGIKEPMNTKIIHIKKINVVLVPLVGFDKHCNRIGMGCGFYDRTFAFKSGQYNYTNPKLYGLAYHFQNIKIKPNLWDIKLDKVITDSYIINK